MTTKRYLTQAVNRNPIPQSEPLPGTNQIRNSAGGYSWSVGPWERLRRFLILGSEGGSYYATERALTIENANNVLACIDADGLRVVSEIVMISDENRAPKNDPAIFALALAASAGDDVTRRAALEALPKVCRTGTHLFTFAEFIKAVRGWGRGLRRAMGAWYTEKSAQDVAFQAVKYRQREGWAHADVLRLAHPTPADETQNQVFKWIVDRAEAGEWVTSLIPPEDEALAFIWGFERVQQAETVAQVVELIQRYNLPREALPTEWLKTPEVWEALLPTMPITALIRNLANMTKSGLVTPLSAAEDLIVERLKDVNRLRKGRVHPISVLSALRVYALGYSPRGGWGAYRRYGEPEWEPTARVIDALDAAFELSFQSIAPANQRFLLGLDVSGSMGAGEVAGVAGLTPREASAAMALVTARTEPHYGFVAFQDKLTPLDISARMRLDDVVQAISGLPFGGTDCALPMLYAMERKLNVDVFVIYTDSETWYGKVHPAVALQQYRDQTGIAAKLIVVGMVANDFTIADPDDAGMLDVVGFDSAAPAVMADFARGEL